MAEHDIMSKQETSPSVREEMRAKTRYTTPAVDIFETEENLVLIADMPGVEDAGLDIRLEKGILTLQGELKRMGKGHLLYHEFSSDNYYRQFKLPDHLNAEKASAKLNNGVLTLTIPKVESAKPMRIEIRH